MGGLSRPATPSAPQDMPTMSADSAPSAGWDAPMSEEGAFLPEPSPDAGYGGVPANAKIIYTATLSLETKEFDAAASFSSSSDFSSFFGIKSDLCLYRRKKGRDVPENLLFY